MNTLVRILVAAGALAAASASAATTWVVPTNFPTIQDAVNSASVVDGDTIQVDSALFTSQNGLAITKNLVIERIGAGTVTITNTGLANAVNIAPPASAVTLRGFSISGATFHGIEVQSGGIFAIDNCAVDGNGAAGPNAGSGLNVANVGTGTVTLNITNSSFNSNSHRGMTFDAPGNVVVNASNVSIDGNNELGILAGNPGGLTLALNFTNVTLDGNARGMVHFTPNGTVTWNGGSCSGNTATGLQPDNQSGRVFNISGVTFDGNGESGVALFGQGDYTFTNCRMRNNGFEGINRFFWAVGTPTTITMTGCEVSGNGGNGLRIDVNDPTPHDVDVTLTECTFTDNNVGGEGNVYILGNGVRTLTAERCTFVQSVDAASHNVHMTGSTAGLSSVELTNCLVVDGQNAGLGLRTAGGELLATALHCTFAATGSPEASNGVVADADTANGVTVTLQNCIVSGWATGIALIGIGAPSMSGSDYDLWNNATDFFGLGAGAGPNDLVAVDPLFVALGNYRLQTGSPAIDAGTDLGITVDLAGIPRDSAPDLGAYEHVTTTAAARWSLYR